MDLIDQAYSYSIQYNNKEDKIQLEFQQLAVP